MSRRWGEVRREIEEPDHESYDDERNYADATGGGVARESLVTCDLCEAEAGEDDLETVDGVTTCTACKDDLHSIELDDPLTVSLEDSDADDLAAELEALDAEPYDDHEAGT